MSSDARLAAPATEQRLKQIIETAPVSLIVLDETGQLLAANRTALSLFGVKRPDALGAANIASMVAADDHDAFSAFLGTVCRGQAGSLEYAVSRADGSRLVLETHAVAIRRAEGDGAAFLGATWDVTARRRMAEALEELEDKHAAATADADALRASLDEARAATNAAISERLAERLQADEAIRRLQASVAEADARHASLASAWTAERETLTLKLARAEEENARLASELQAEQAARNAAEQTHGEHFREALARATGERAQLQQEWEAIQARHEADLATLRAERDQLVQTIQDLNRSYAALVSEHTAERAEAEAALRAERARSAEVTAERDQWRADLAAIVRAFTDASSNAQQLLDRTRNMRLVSARGEQADAAADLSSPVNAATGTDAESSWQF